MGIQEICNLLKAELLNNGYEYGFIVNGQKYRPNMKNGFDHEYYQLAKTISVVQEPSVTRKEKIGTCVDTVTVMKSLLDELNVPGKIWLLYNRKKNKVHTILTFEAECKIVYLELTPQSSKAWYGHEIIYSSEQELLQEYGNNGYEISDVTDSVIVGQRPFFLLNKLKENLTDEAKSRVRIIDSTRSTGKVSEREFSVSDLSEQGYLAYRKRNIPRL